MEFTVSVRLMTYNHELYIREAIESILKQEANFSIEIVVGDDFSTDRTLDIIREYAGTENIHIKILERKVGDEYWKERREKGRLFNFTNILKNCTGKYIALLDGDDYWTDPLKLQKQVDFLEQNNDCILCHHWQEIAEVNDKGKFVRKPAPMKGHGYYNEQKASVVKVFSNELRVKIRNVMFRNCGLNFPDWYYDVNFGDVPLSMLLGKLGKFGFIDEPMAVYRLTSTGYSKKGSENWLYTYNHFMAWIRIWEYGNNYYGGMYKKEALRTILNFYNVILKKYDYSHKVFVKMLSYNLLESKLNFGCRIELFLKLPYLFVKGRFARSH